MAIPTIGAIPPVADGADILTDWGNAVGSSAAGRTVNRFVTRATRDAAIVAPVEGMLTAITGDPSGGPYLSMVQNAAWRPLLIPRQAGHVTLAAASGNGPTFDRTVNLGAAVPVDSLVLAWCVGNLGFMPGTFTNGTVLMYTNQAASPGAAGALICQGFVIASGASGTWYPTGTTHLGWKIAAGFTAQAIVRGQWTGPATSYLAADVSYVIFDAPSGGPIPTTYVAPVGAEAVEAQAALDAMRATAVGTAPPPPEGVAA